MAGEQFIGNWKLDKTKRDGHEDFMLAHGKISVSDLYIYTNLESQKSILRYRAFRLIFRGCIKPTVNLSIFVVH